MTISAYAEKGKKASAMPSGESRRISAQREEAIEAALIARRKKGG